MNVLFWGTAIFTLAFVLHLIIWKIRLPKKQTATLLVTFFSVLGVTLLSLLVAGNICKSAEGCVPLFPGEYISIIFFFTSLTLAYIITYSAMEADSPTLVMIMAIANAGPAGLDKNRFEELMTDDVLVIPRINDLVRDNLVQMIGDSYCLTPKGESFINIFIVYRRLLKLNLRGG